MLGAQWNFRTVLCLKALTDQGNASGSSSSCCCCCSTFVPNPPAFCSVRLGWCKTLRRRFVPKPIVISCKSNSNSGGSSSGDRPDNDPDDDPDRHYLQASLLISETLTHYRMRQRQGFQEDMTWESSSKLFVQSRGSRPDVSSMQHEFLRRFQSPTIFLKISCDGDFLLPIIVGEFAVEKLVESLKGVVDGDCPDQFLLVKNIVETLGYEVKMVRITERVANTYFARLYFSKPGENDVLSVDARPSDAINVANRCKAPIYVNKQIVLTDAIRIGYGMGRGRSTKPTYDVSLDSAADGPDVLTQELGLIRNMNLAVKEERYYDAAMWRDKIIELRKLRHEQ